MGRSERLSSIAYECAKDSDLNIKHGAVVTKGSKILFTGMNTSRSKSLDKIYYCEHAEVNVIRQLFTRLFRKKDKKWTKRNIGKFIVWVVRVNSTCEHSDDFKVTESKPCQQCIDSLRSFGFKKIGYSTIDGEMVVEKIENLEGILSSAQRHFIRKFNSQY